MIHVIATLEIAAGRREEFLKAFRELTPKVRAEDGCIEYGAAVDTDAGIEGQVVKGENVVTVVEKWESVAALKAHLEAPHMQEFRGLAGGLITGRALNILEPA